MKNFLRHSFAKLPQDFYHFQEPEPFEHPFLVHENLMLKKDLSIEGVDSSELIKIFNRQSQNTDFQPLSMAYAGHQFGQYVPNLGDGRGVLFAEVEVKGMRLDLHLKGAGKTPYSRFGDGRAVLRSVIREYLCGEAMHALSIPTSRALMIIGSDEPVIREKTEKAAMMVRTAQTHIRFGSFEYFYYQNQPEQVKALADYCIDQYPCFDVSEGQRYQDFFKVVVKKTALLIAKWQACGFCHGVLNTDNMSILGETLDYGPYGFMEDYFPGYVCNHSDHQGRYAYKNQPYIGLWNCSALGHALSSLIGEKEQEEILGTYEQIFQAELASMYRKKLGLMSEAQEDTSIIQGLLEIMENEKLDYTNTFRNLKIALTNKKTPELKSENAKEWIQSFQARHLQDRQNDKKKSLYMDAVNPKFILRNYMAQEVIDSAEESEHSMIEQLLEILSKPYTEHPEFDRYADKAPEWAKNLEISCSS